MSVALRIARSARLVATGFLRTNSRLAATMQQKYCDQGRSDRAVDDDVADLLRPQLLRVWRKAQIGINLAFGEQPLRLRPADG